MSYAGRAGDEQSDRAERSRVAGHWIRDGRQDVQICHHNVRHDQPRPADRGHPYPPCVDFSLGVLIEECDFDKSADNILNRELSEPDDIRVELVLTGAQDLYMSSRPDVAEIYSNPKICQEATAQKFDGTSLRPG